MENKEMDKKINKYTVSELNRLSRQTLEIKFPFIWVEGEVSNFSKAPSGHWYFKMKDESAAISCAMFRGQNSRSTFIPKNGIKVLARCKVTIYEVSGSFQLIVEQIEDIGAGALQKKFEDLKKRLLDHGIFDDKHKLPIPRYPKKIGLITSPKGAAIQDILSVLKRRYPATKIIIYPSIVQGKTQSGISASEELTKKIIFANEINICDVLILSRGGGSIEDLWAFNDESLAWCIHKSKIPIISAVGHEIDYTISDFVADYRAPTPSAAAEIVSPDMISVIKILDNKEAQLSRMMIGLIQTRYHRADNLYRRLRNPNYYLLHIKIQIKNLEQRIHKCISLKVNTCKEKLVYLDKNLLRYHPTQFLRDLSDHLSILEQKLNNRISEILLFKSEQWENNSRLLHAVSPLNTLNRGYAIVLDKHKKLIKNTSDIKVNDRIFTMFEDGGIFSKVDEIQINKKSIK